MKRDYRRETKLIVENILNKFGWTHERLALEMSCTSFTVSRWANGHTSPSSKDFEHLKQLANGTLPQSDRSPDKTLSEILGRLDQITKQIAELQTYQGAINYRVGLLESEKKTVREVPSEPDKHKVK